MGQGSSKEKGKRRRFVVFVFENYWATSSEKGMFGDTKVSCILRHQDVQLILTYSWAKPAILVAG